MFALSAGKSCVRRSRCAICEYRYLGDARRLKEILAIRDRNDAFLPIKEAGAIGIPALVKNDGEEIHFDIETMDLSALPKKG